MNTEEYEFFREDSTIASNEEVQAWLIQRAVNQSTLETRYGEIMDNKVASEYDDAKAEERMERYGFDKYE